MEVFSIIKVVLKWRFYSEVYFFANDFSYLKFIVDSGYELGFSHITLGLDISNFYP